MVDIYKTNAVTGMLDKIEAPVKGCWINIVKPTEQELEFVSQSASIDQQLLKYPLDVSEKAHIDRSEKEVLIVIDSPTTIKKQNKKLYTTMPLGMILVRDDIFITISPVKINIIENMLINYKPNSIQTEKKSRFVFQILYDMAKDFIKYLTYINKDLEKFEEHMEKTMSNKELLNILDFEKTMIYFDASAKANQGVLERLKRGKSIKLYEEDEEILEDTLIENRQAIEMIQTYSEILNGITDVFGTIVSNNLNIVMKFLTSITVIIAIPTLVASILGMNVQFPFSTGIDGFHIVMIVSTIITVLAAIWLKRKDLL